MTELGYVELPFIRCLRDLGWTYRTDEQLEVYNRTTGDPSSSGFCSTPSAASTPP